MWEAHTSLGNLEGHPCERGSTAASTEIGVVGAAMTRASNHSTRESWPQGGSLAGVGGAVVLVADGHLSGLAHTSWL